MKKIFASVLALTVLIGAGNAHAWFWEKDNNNEINYRQTSNRAQNVAYKNHSENKKWIYNGNNAYRSIAGQAAFEDRIDDNEAAFIVRPVRSGNFNASLRQGDTGQSMQTRINHTFNN